MDSLIEHYGRDTFLAFLIFIGCVIRAGKGERVPVLEGLLSAFVPFFVVLCLIWILEYALSWFGVVLPIKPLGATGGLFGFLGNYWVSALMKDGRSIQAGGASASLLSIIKSILTLTKKN